MNPISKEQVLTSLTRLQENNQKKEELLKERQQLEQYIQVLGRMDVIIAQLSNWHALVSKKQNSPEKQNLSQQIGLLIIEAKNLKTEASKSTCNKVEVLRAFQALGQKATPMGEKVKLFLTQ